MIFLLVQLLMNDVWKCNEMVRVVKIFMLKFAIFILFVLCFWVYKKKLNKRKYIKKISLTIFLFFMILKKLFNFFFCLQKGPKPKKLFNFISREIHSNEYNRYSNHILWKQSKWICPQINKTNILFSFFSTNKPRPACFY
jgi:hypothetical protein